jgi:hypothetical protein
MRVVDGYVQFAHVFYDANANGILDDGEVDTWTEADGSLKLEGVTLVPGGRLVVLPGGIDAETGNSVGLLMASGDPTITVVSPLTLILALNPSLSEAQLKAALGLDPSVDLRTFDPIKAMDHGSPAMAKIGLAIFSAQQQIYALIQSAAAAAGSGGAGDALTKAVSALGGAIAAVDVTQPVTSMLNSLVSQTLSVLITDPAQLAAISSVLTASLHSIADTYGGGDGGLAMLEARRLLASGTASGDELAKAIAVMANAKAAASASQSMLLKAVTAVATATPDQLKALVENFSSQLNAEIASQAEAYTQVLKAQAGEQLMVGDLPGYLVSQLPSLDAAHIAEAMNTNSRPNGSASISTPDSTTTPTTASTSANVVRRVRVNAAATAMGPMNSMTTPLPRSMRAMAK